MKIVYGNLILEKDTIFNRDLIVKGDIIGKNGKKYDLVVKGDLWAENINIGKLYAKNIKIGNINASDIFVEDIDSLSILAYKIIARDIIAFNINAEDILAKNIRYYKECFAYRNIRCSSIKGSHNKAEHTALEKIILKK